MRLEYKLYNYAILVQLQSGCHYSRNHCFLKASTLDVPLWFLFQVSNFNSSNITSVTLVIKYTYNCTTRHYCHSTCQHYYRTREQKRRASRSSEPEDRCHNDISHKDRASRYCSADDMNTFKQTTTLEVLFPSELASLMSWDITQNQHTFLNSSWMRNFTPEFQPRNWCIQHRFKNVK